MYCIFGGTEPLTSDEIKAGAVWGNAGFDKNHKIRKGKLIWLSLGESLNQHLSLDPKHKTFNKMMQQKDPTFRIPYNFDTIVEKRLSEF